MNPTLREARAVSVALDTFFSQLGEKRGDDSADLNKMGEAIAKVAAVIEPDKEKCGFGFQSVILEPEPPEKQ